MKAVGRNGKVVVTNHDEPEAVILSAQEYGIILQALQVAAAPDQSALEALARRFDQRLVSLQAADAGDRLRALLQEPAKLGGKIKVGAASH